MRNEMENNSTTQGLKYNFQGGRTVQLSGPLFVSVPPSLKGCQLSKSDTEVKLSC